MLHGKGESLLYLYEVAAISKGVIESFNGFIGRQGDTQILGLKQAGTAL
jgi:hypothetical protein